MNHQFAIAPGRMLRHVGVCAMGWVLALVSVPAVGQTSPTRPADEGNRVLRVHLRQSEIVNFPWPARRVSVTDPKIADVQVLAPGQALVQGKASGTTDLIAWSEREEVWRAKVVVEYDVTRMKADLSRLLPNSALSITQGQDDFVVVSGQLTRAEHAVELKNYLAAYGGKFVDMTSLAGVQQVQLRVRLAEVSRSSLRVLGFNAFITGKDVFGGVQPGPSSGGAFNGVSIGPPSGASAAAAHLPFEFSSGVGVNPLVTIFAGFPQANLEFFLQALSENQYLRILAEPTLVALSGEQADFLAGGEFPIPVVQGGGNIQGTSITVEYKEFGVRLKFRPTVLGDGTIRLYVAPEVSQLSDVGAVVIQGFRIPGLVTRRAQTTLELHSGQSFAMAGLLNRVSTGTSSRIPGLGDIPVVGALFRSVRYESDDTDLVVLVTASLVEPMSTATPPPLPGVLHSDPSDWELYGLAKLEGSAMPKISPAQAKWIKELGFDRLKGPGAWESYESRGAGERERQAPSRPEAASGPTAASQVPVE